MKLVQTILDDNGKKLSERSRKMDDHFDLDAYDWNDNKKEMIAEAMED